MQDLLKNNLSKDEVEIDFNSVLCGGNAMFTDLNAAADFIMRCQANQKNKDAVIAKIKKAIKNNIKCYGLKWKVKKVKKGDF